MLGDNIICTRCKHPMSVHTKSGCMILHRSGMCFCRKNTTNSGSDFNIKLAREIESREVEYVNRTTTDS